MKGEYDMRKRNKLWSFALAGALAVSNMSAVVAMPMTSLVAQAANYTSTIKPTTAAGNIALVGNNKYEVNVTDVTLSLPEYEASDTAISTNDTLTYMVSINGGAASAVGTLTQASQAGTADVAATTYDLTGRAGKTLTISVVLNDVDHAQEEPATKILASIEVDIIQGNAATVEDLEKLITLEAQEDSVLIGDTNVISAVFDDKDASVIVPADAKFAIVLKDGDGGRTEVTRDDSASTDGTKYGSTTNATFSGQKAAGTYTATLQYDADGAGAGAAVDVVSKAITVLPGTVKEFGTITEEDDNTTIGINDSTGLTVTVPATLYKSAPGSDKLSFKVVGKTLYDAAYKTAVKTYEDKEDDFEASVIRAVDLTTAKATMTAAITSNLANATGFTLTKGTATNNKTNYSQNVKITTGTTAEKGDYYLLAYETAGTDGRIVGNYAFSVVDSTSLAFQISASDISEKVTKDAQEPIWQTTLAKEIKTGESVTFKPYSIKKTTDDTNDIYTGTEIKDAAELAKITYSTIGSGKNYIDVDPNTGEVFGKSAGTAVVKAEYKYSNNVVLTSKINVTVANADLRIHTADNSQAASIPAGSLYAGEEENLVVFYDGKKVLDNITWSVKESDSSTATNSTKARVNENNAFVADEAGTYYVFASYKVTDESEPIVSTSFSVVVDANDLVLYSNAAKKTTITTYTGNIGEEKSVYAYFGAEEYTDKVTWESSEPTVATVDGGLIKLEAKGSTVIKASFKDAKGKILSKTVDVTVKADNYTIAAESSEATTTFGNFLVGDSAKVVLNHNGKVDTETAFTWKSDDEKVVTIDPDGTVKAVGVGTANINAFDANINKINNTAFTVTVKPTALKLYNSTAPNTVIDGNKVALATGEEATIIAKYGHQEVEGEWTVTNAAKQYVKVTSNGKITAVKDTDSLTTANDACSTTNKYTFATFKYNDAIDPVVLEVKITDVATASTFLAVGTEDGTNKVGEGTEAQLVVKYGNQDITSSAVFSSDTPSVATVGEKTGIVKGVSQGSTTITATYTINGVEYKGTQSIAVTEKLGTSSVVLNKSVVELGLGETEQLTATIVPIATTDKAVWTSSDESVVTVTDGLIKAVGKGEATVTINSGKESATCKVTVTKAAEEAEAENAAIAAAEEAAKNPSAENIKALEEAIADAEKAGVDQNTISALKDACTKATAIKTAGDKADAAVSAPTDDNLAALEKAIADAKAAGASDADVKAAEEKLTAALKTAKTNAQNDAKTQKDAADKATTAQKTAEGERDAAKTELNTTKGQLDTANKTIADTAADAKLAKTLKANKNKTKTVSGTKYKTDADGGQSVAVTKGKNVKTLTVKSSVKISGYSYKVRALNAKAFTGKKIRTIKIAGNYLKNVDVNAFKNTKATKITITKAKNVKTQLKAAAKAAGLKYSVKGTTVTITKK